VIEDSQDIPSPNKWQKHVGMQSGRKKKKTYRSRISLVRKTQSRPLSILGGVELGQRIELNCEGKREVRGPPDTLNPNTGTNILKKVASKPHKNHHDTEQSFHKQRKIRQRVSPRNVVLNGERAAGGNWFTRKLRKCCRKMRKKSSRGHRIPIV